MPAYRTRDTNNTLSLEVSTTSLQAPTVAIISPTPRAFTFPFHSNDLHISPSSSPFEPDLKPLSFSPVPDRTSSPTSSITSESSSSSPISAIYLAPTRQQVASQPIQIPTATTRRRKSFGGDSLERRPKKGDEDYIKRPENAFILFRRKCCEERLVPDGSVEAAADEGATAISASPVKKQRQADLSKMISQQWKSLSPAEKQYWEDLAKEKKKEHEQMYPNYVYRPQRTKPVKGKKIKGRRGVAGESEQDTDVETFTCIRPFQLPASSSRLLHGRARSAPTPPLENMMYQTVHIPTIYMPSCPSSPTLYPSQSRRTPLPRLSLDQDLPASMTYDDSLMPPPSFSHPHDFETNLQNEMFQGMFDLPGQSTPFDNKAVSLPSLSIPRDESTMALPEQMISPSSSYSTTPGTPQQSPYTPLPGFLQSRSHVSDRRGMSYISEEQQSCLGMEGAEVPDMTFYAWQTAAGIWPTEADDHDEYDVNAIPPVEIGVIPSHYEQREVRQSELTPTLAMNVNSGSCHNDNSREFCPPRESGHAESNDLFTGMFSFNEPLMW